MQRATTCTKLMLNGAGGRDRASMRKLGVSVREVQGGWIRELKVSNPDATMLTRFFL